jgi:hypothetical protein
MLLLNTLLEIWILLMVGGFLLSSASINRAVDLQAAGCFIKLNEDVLVELF